MAKRWSEQDTSYLKRYAAGKTLAALAERFGVGDDEVRARLAALGLVTKDGEPVRRGAAARDPEIGDYEKALASLGAGDFAKAAKLLERVVVASDRPELAARARQHLTAIARRTATGGEETDPYTRAVFERNRGDVAAALALVERQKKDDDGRFACLAAALHCLEGREEAAAEALRRAIEKDPANRVRAFHDPDLAPLRRNEEHAHLFGLVPS